MRAVLLVLVLAWVPVASHAQDEDDPYDARFDAPSEERRLRLTAWGGGLVDLKGGAGAATLLGGEVSYALGPFDVGVLAQGYRLDPSRSARSWTPVILARIEERFETRRGVEAVLAVGLGAAHTRASSWQGWYQLALGMRIALGPVFLAAEIGFEQEDLFRLAGGLGVGF